MEPEKLLYASSHEWIAVDEDHDTATIGISAFAVEQLTDLVYIELPEVGASVTAGNRLERLSRSKR
jgi:glycine cleavage system H protein